MALSLEQLLNMGVDLKEFDSYAHKVELARRRAKYKQNPDKAVAQRERTSISFLRRQGYAVIDLKQMPPPPWDDLPLNDFVNAGEDMWQEWQRAQQRGACE